MRMNLVAVRLPSRSALDGVAARTRADLVQAATTGMRRHAVRVRASVQGHVQSKFKGTTVARSMKVKVWAQKADRFPELQVYSKVPWLAVHQTGATITGRMLIPIGLKGRGRKKFRELITSLLATKQAFFRKGRGGKLYVFAKPPKGTRGLAGARRIERSARAAAGSRGAIRRGEAYPIALVTSRVQIRKRLSVDRQIQRELPGMMEAMRLK